MEKLPKIFVLDTNVILHDHNCIYKFQENDIMIPIMALEELDHFKKGNEQINYNAREFARAIDKLSDEKVFNGGVSLGKGLGSLTIALLHSTKEEIKKTFIEDTPDHRILLVAMEKKKQYPDRTVILVSKDVNLRLKAKALGLLAEDYLNDKIQTVDHLKREVISIKVKDEVVASLYQEKDGIDAKPLKKKFYSNQYVSLNGKSSNVMSVYKADEDKLKLVKKQYVSGIEPRNDEQMLALDALMRPEIQLVALTGIAGTGKTLLALAAAIAQESQYEQILLARPVIPLQNQEIGFLPGDINDKIGPYMLPLYDNLTFIKNRLKYSQRDANLISELENAGKLSISPLAYIRGRSLSDTFFIIDEAQNLTPHEVKTIITRAGEGSKFVLTGDIHQIDSPYLDIRSNGLSYLTDKMIGQDIFAHVNLVKGERSHLADVAGKLL